MKHNQQPQQQHPVLSLQTKEDLNQQQMATLMMVMQNLQPFLLESRGSIFEDPKRPELDGGAQAAAVSAFSKLCDRIEQMLDEKKRWKVDDFHDKLQKSIMELHALQKEFLTAQRDSALQIQRPSFQFKPEIFSMSEGGYFLAFWGDIKRPGYAIIGRGETPRAALKDFDEAFDRAPAEQLTVIAEDLERNERKNQKGGIMLPSASYVQHIKKEHTDND